jgi:hypothetical protein
MLLLKVYSAIHIRVGRLRQVFLLMSGRRWAQHQFDSIDDLINWVMTWEPSFAIEGLPFAVYSTDRAQTLGWALSRSLR